MHTPSNSHGRHSSETGPPELHHADAVYRGLTLAAMLLLLASLWVSRLARDCGTLCEYCEATSRRG